ncbi:MAG: NUDIX hydrolase [Bacilli bacterium]|nr:NUDIX hydrolase [Bacilli bacterium]
MTEMVGHNLNINSVKDNEEFIAVNLIITKIENGKEYFLFGKRAAHKSGGGQLGLIGGTKEKSESMEETAKREAKEEIGIDIKGLKYSNFAYIESSAEVSFTHYAYVVTDYEGTPVNLEEKKCDGLFWVSREDLEADLSGEGISKYFISIANILNYFEGVEHDDKNDYSYKNGRTM